MYAFWLCLSAAAAAQEDGSNLDALKDDIARQRAEIERQAEELDQQRAELDALERRLEVALAGESAGAATPEVTEASDDEGPGFVANEPTLILTGAELIQ